MKVFDWLSMINFFYHSNSFLERERDRICTNQFTIIYTTKYLVS